MAEIIKVAVLRPLWDTYDYKIPADLDVPSIGARVRVPFGPASAVGVVVGKSTESSYNLKPIDAVLDVEPVFSNDLMKLGEWMASYYHHPIGSVFETFLPSFARRGKQPDLSVEQNWNVVGSSSPPDFKNAIRQKEVWEFLKEFGPVSDTELAANKIPRAVLKALLKKGWVEAHEAVDESHRESSELSLTSEQSVAVRTVLDSMGRYSTHLLEGVTGSGKTEVYLRVLEQVLARGQQALVLVPEISLTPQTTDRFERRFPDVHSLHSMVPDGQRFNTWAKCGKGMVSVLVGTRSSVFTPFKNLGVIVVDEEHDASFKQTESLRYSARDIAVMRARELGIPCILGSATPSLESVLNCEKGLYSRSRLSHRPGTAEMPEFHVHDIRGQVLTSGMSEPLLQNIEKHLKSHGQVLILINRRGYSPSFFCTECSWRARCESCEVNLVWHEIPVPGLHCHHCLRRVPRPTTCPECHSSLLTPRGAGTQRIEATLRERFPTEPIYRVDRDEIKTHRQMSNLYRKLRDSTNGILIGTQMLAKGHHFPNVTLVAVLSADGGFLSTDFRGPERTAQLIVQVAGRAGRAERRGEVWIQSYDPENPNLQSLVEHGYPGFLSSEITLRREALVPPFSHWAVIRAEGQVVDETVAFIKRIMDAVPESGVGKMGPVAAPIERIDNRFRFQGVVHSTSRQSLRRALASIERERTKSKRIRWSIDVDPTEMF